MTKKAFSLIELAVVILIMSFIFVSITSASKLRNMLHARAIIQEFNKIEMAVNNFTNSYNFLPGDFPKASTYFGSTSANNGNGNGIFDTNASSEEEVENAAEHLYASGVFTSLEKVDDASFRSEIVKTGTYKFVEHCTSMTNGLYNSADHIFSATLINPNGAATWTPVISAYNAFSIDQKIDDGAAQTGKIIGFVLSANNSTYNCLNASSTVCSTSPSSADYVRTNKNLGCAISLGLNAILQK
jgi:hypothetical protein